MNPYAPYPLQAPVGELPYDYVLDVSLTAAQNTVAIVDIERDSPFVWRAVIIAAATGTFAVRFSDSRQYFLSSARISSQNLSATPEAPTPIVPELELPAGGKLLVDLLDTSGAPNTIQFVFRGVKRAGR